MDWADFFHGYVPAAAIFNAHAHFVDGLHDRLSDLNRNDPHLHIQMELSLIGLASHFEAFCKDHFASLINICPQLLERFGASRGDVTIHLSDLLKVADSLPYRMGSVIAEKYDFGSAKKINALFSDLLKISPFTKDEQRRYEMFLEDRNLLVHHGGTYTLAYSRNPIEDIESKYFGYSLIITRESYDEWKEFLIKIVTKVAKTSQISLKEYVNEKGLLLTPEAAEAVDLLTL
ncbi:MAG: hypothetical protein DMF63_13595 [Acidobacteria bacterium]|nr:MAG: hypothetical protein DMF63_13595 [Acidobacteriota bacterium]